MTPQPQQTEYFMIIGNEMRLLMTISNSKEMREARKKAWDDAHSRPVPSMETITKELALELCMDARKEAAAQAREKVLDEVIENISNFDNHDMTRGEAIRIIESLRTGGEPR